jgi:predicted NBD/HSP70 family sugar kinase
MSVLTADLLERGILTAESRVHGTGRPSTRLALSASSAFFIGVSLASDPYILRVTDLHGEVVATDHMAASASPETIVASIAAAVARVLESGTVDAGRITGIGLAIPGLVDATASTCIRSTLLGWRDVAIGAMIAEATGLPTFIENDANALALGEHLFGSLRGSDAGAVISVGDGIGCGLIVNGELHRGSRGGAGEIAHSTIEPGGLPCKCGKRGCLDTLASLRSIGHFAREAGLPDDPLALDALASDGDNDAIAILHRAGAALGLAISQLVQTLDPERIVVAVTEGLTDGLYARVMRQTVEANVMPSESPQVQLTTIGVDQQAWAIGAASVAAGRALFRL